MENKEENLQENIKKSFLAAYQNFQFSKSDCLVESADIERRCLFLKSTTCSNNTSEEDAEILLDIDLENYANLIDDRNGLNNYWKQFNLLKLNIENNPQEWKSSFSNPQVATEFLKPLSCNKDSTLPCRNKNLNNRDIEKVIDLWKNTSSSSPRIRKISQQESIKSFLKCSQNQEKYKSPSQKVPSHTSGKIEESLSISKSPKDNFSLFKPIEPTQKNYQTKTNFNSNLNYNPISSKKSNSYKDTQTSRTNFNKNSNNNQRSPKTENIHNKPTNNIQGPQKTENSHNKFTGFKTARTELNVQQSKKNYQPPVKKSLGGKAVNAQYVNPFLEKQKKEEPQEPEEPTDERLKNIDPKMIELIKNEIMDIGKPIYWDDIAGLEDAKRIIKEIVVFPMLRPDIFTGLRRPPKGILLFGPPGTGKTLIGKCIAAQSKSTFFSISASSLTSKWIGEGEKMVRALFAVARVEQPSVVFIDEIDSLLCQRSETEHESSRRMKTEFLVQLDGATTGDEDRILVIGATNRPYELDEAARRRLVKRLYIPLPELEARSQIVRNLLKSENHNLNENDVIEIAKLSDGYSGADMTNLCKEASMGPIRSIPFTQLESINTDNVRDVTIDDFKQALIDVRPSVSQKDLQVYLDWDAMYGSASRLNRQ